MARSKQSKRNPQSNSRRRQQWEGEQNVRNVIVNQQVIVEGVPKKRWSKHDIIAVKPLTEHQRDAFQCWYQDDEGHLAMLGSAGCGKSFLAIFLAMQEVLDPDAPQRSLKIVRSVVQTRQVGALPGTLEEKKAPLFHVYEGIFSDLFGRKSTLNDMVAAGLVELIDTSYIRGDTWDNSIVFVDEVTSMNDHEVDTVMTRVGNNSRVIIGGDEKQSDLSVTSNKLDKHNYSTFYNTLRNMKSMCVVEFDYNDIVRSGFCREWIMARMGKS